MADAGNLNPADQINEEGPRLRRWPGVVFSLLVPGFGLVRAGHTARGIGWFLALQLASCGVAFAMIFPWVPVAFALGLFGGLLVLFLAMLCDSFRPGRISRKLAVLFTTCLILITLLPMPASFIEHSFRVPTEAMAPTLSGDKQGVADQVFVNRLSYLFTPPRRGDIVVFATSSISGITRPPESYREVYYLKRVAGLPGERIEIKDGAVWANGRKLGAADGLPPVYYVNLPGALLLNEGGGYTLGPKEYFVLGDNSEHSSDSRFWGPVPAAAIYGQVARIYYPFSRIGTPH